MGCFFATPDESESYGSQSLSILISNPKKKGSSPILFKINQSGSILMNEDAIYFQPALKTIQENTNVLENNTPLIIKGIELIKVNWGEECLEIMPNDNFSPRDTDTLKKCWYILDPKDKAHILKVGEVIKFGKVKLKVKSLEANANKEIIITNEKMFTQESGIDSSRISMNEEEELKESKSVCKICLDDDFDDNNPMVQPCKCSGSIKKVHIACLRRWYAENVVTMDSTYLSCFYWQELKCELCKNLIPNEISFQGKAYSLVETPIVNEPHIKFECFMNDNSNGLFIVRYIKKKNELRVGSAEKCEIRVNDPSVAKDHASLKFEENTFKVRSNSSKMTTRVSIQNNVIPFSMLKDMKIKLNSLTFNINAISYKKKL